MDYKLYYFDHPSTAKDNTAKDNNNFPHTRPNKHYRGTDRDCDRDLQHISIGPSRLQQVVSHGLESR
jgi:hypothetical protein